jgi:hypothetical protein
MTKVDIMAGFAWRTLVVLHRYLGIAVGLLMLAWFVSGIVMMYVGFPQRLGDERLRSLPPIAWQTCCRVAEGVVPEGQPVARAEIEMLRGVPVLHLPRPPVPDQVIDLADGTQQSQLGIGEAQEIALAAVRNNNGETPRVAAAEEIEEDQWTLNRFHQDQPTYRFSFGDAYGTVLYVSGNSGRAVMRTTASERFWNWLGAIPHWLYFKELRTDGLLWTRTVIWTSIFGTFLTLVGLYLGIAQWGRGKDGRLSPYRGWFYWHHIMGLAFGIVALVFVFSGLMSLNPWGFLESRGGGERARLEGATPRWAAVRTSLDALRARAVVAVHLSLSRYGGDIYWFATAVDGTVRRLDAFGNAAPITEGDLAIAAARLAGENGIATQGLTADADAYYVGQGGRLPVYRVIANDAESTRYYLDPTTGALVGRADANRRWHRWLYGAIHRLDFAAWIRVRPVWDIILIALMIGGFAVSATGIWLAVRRVSSDVILLFRAAAGITRSNAAAGRTRPS